MLCRTEPVTRSHRDTAATECGRVLGQSPPSPDGRRSWPCAAFPPGAPSARFPPRPSPKSQPHAAATGLALSQVGQSIDSYDGVRIEVLDGDGDGDGDGEAILGKDETQGSSSVTSSRLPHPARRGHRRGVRSGPHQRGHDRTRRAGRARHAGDRPCGNGRRHGRVPRPAAPRRAAPLKGVQSARRGRRMVFGSAPPSPGGGAEQ